MLPWPFKRFLLIKVYGYVIDNTAKIGYSWIFPDKLIMRQGARIGSLNFIKGLEYLYLGKEASIGNINWITAFPKKNKNFFKGFESRNPHLTIDNHSCITNRHLIDCTDSIAIGEYTTIAGFRSQLLTHSIDLKLNRQSCYPIKIGSYAFIGTDVVILPGTELPSYSILGAKSLARGRLNDEYSIYSGIPAVKVKNLEKEHYLYFSRTSGRVY